jgi:hypothetical protein
VRLPGEGISLTEDRDFRAGRYRLAASLEATGFAAPFDALCLDLLQLSLQLPGPAEAMEAVARRMATWMAALRRRAGLSDEEARGLIGELLSLRALVDRVGWEAAITAWQGPDRGLHDFSLGGAAWEIKTSAGPGSAVWINGLDQLDDTGLTGLVLVHVGLAEAAAGSPLREVAAEARTEVARDAPAALAELQRKLLAAGYTGTEAAGDTTYEVSSISFYHVRDGFPRFRRADAPSGVDEVQYRLQTASIGTYLIGRDEALALLGAGKGAGS